MENQPVVTNRKLKPLPIIIAVIIVAAIGCGVFLLIRHYNHSPKNAKTTQSKITEHKTKASPSTPPSTKTKQTTVTNKAQTTPSTSATSTTTTNTTTTHSTQLDNTGPGQTVKLFLAVVAIGTMVHHYYIRQRHITHL
jgi:cytoskeletal protein RodZ